MPDEITIIIPTYKESENLAELINRIRKVTTARIMIVDDSPDKSTVNIARDMDCMTVYRGQKFGLSSAVLDGLKMTDSEKVIVMDADLQHPPEALPSLIKALETNDFVVMSRYIPGGDCQEWDLDRKIISRVANLAARPITSVKDAVSGFFGFHRKGLCGLPVLLDTINDKGFKIMLELLAKGEWGNIKEVPFTFGIRTRGDTKMRFEQVREYLIQLVQLYIFKYRRIIKFMTVGASGAIVKLSLLLGIVELTGLHYLAAYPLAFFAATANNYFWNSHWTFKEKHSDIKGYFKYCGVSLFTLGINELTLFVLSTLIGIWYIYAAIVGIGIAFIFNFTLSRSHVWNSAKIKTATNK